MPHHGGARAMPITLDITLDDLRRFTVARSLFRPTTLPRALAKMGFVQADPIRAPARAQDLTLRHRVKGYRAGDLERRYADLSIEEDFFVNYGFVTRELQALMHPRPDLGVPAGGARPWSASRRKRASELLDFVRERGAVHPRQADEHFAHGTVRNYWGGTSNATTHLLDAMHYRGLLRVTRREGGVRIYQSREHGPAPTDAAGRRARLDALVDRVTGIYAPLPGPSLGFFVRRLRFAVPQWSGDVKSAIARAKERLVHARVNGVEWYWPAGEDPTQAEAPEVVRLLAPFDPVVQDRARFELLWGWVYRFEAYTPAPRRNRGYYALPLLHGDRVIGWGNLAVKDGTLDTELGYVESRPPRDAAFKRELEAEIERMRVFLGVEA
jgi:uncharacterized protein YcaQ